MKAKIFAVAAVAAVSIGAGAARPVCLETSRFFKERATPESQGVSSKAILEWIDACDAQMKYIHGFVLVRHGKVIAEGTWAPFDTLNEPHMLYSHSKSFTSTAIGFLADEGKLDLDERIADIFADKMPTEPSQRLLQVRVRDLLSMNFGSNPNKGARSDANNPDWEKGILARPMEVADPGRKHRYDSDATYLLSCIVERKSGKRTMEYLKEKLFDPLGMTSPWSTVSTSGTACGGWGMNMTTRDIAKFGQLLLNEGVWDGKRILSKDWVRLATSKQTATSGGPESDWAQGYGFQFWRCRHGAYRADGAAGQFTIVMEDQDAVLSINAGDNDMQRSLNLVWKHILPALGPSALPEDAAAQAKLAERCASLKLPVLENKGVEGAALPASASFGRSDILNAGEGCLERTDSGWVLKAQGHELAIGDGKWSEIKWDFNDSNIEGAFHLVGRRRVAASGAWKDAKTLRVRWFLVGGIQKGEFDIVAASR